MARHKDSIWRERAGDGGRGQEKVGGQVLVVGQGDGHVRGGGRCLQGGMDQGLPDNGLATQLPAGRHQRQLLDVVGHVLVVLHDLLDDFVAEVAGAVLCSLAQQDGVLLPWGDNQDGVG